MSHRSWDCINLKSFAGKMCKATAGMEDYCEMCLYTLLHPFAENIPVTGTPSHFVLELLQHGRDTSGTPKVSNARNAAARESSNSRTGAPGRIPGQGRLCVSVQSLMETKLP